MSGLKSALLAATACLAFASAADDMVVAAVKAAIDGVLNAEYPHLVALYKDIHAHPELGHQEVRTAAILAKEMRALGYEVTEHVGGTGVVAILHNGAGPTVMIRTELDALPMQEKTGSPYASTVQTTWDGKTTYVDHSCGHDIHMAAWVGTAKALMELKSRWHGTVMFIAQPAEETTDFRGHDPRRAVHQVPGNPTTALRAARRRVRLRLCGLQGGRLELELRQPGDHPSTAAAATAPSRSRPSIQSSSPHASSSTCRRSSAASGIRCRWV